MMDVEQCIAKGLLRKDAPDIEKSRKSLAVSGKKLLKADKMQALELFEDALVNCYASMFHAGKALLFRDGIREKSHFGLWVYLNEKFQGTIEKRFLNELNALRLERHEISYGLGEADVTSEQSADALKTAKGFLAAVRRLLEK
ncbi:HEPN domain-containing protein [Candidatus Woesearchaeota archaeon]|nr:HEPN domain-containing protein [Candidatus Woesearchaeota archaeon]